MHVPSVAAILATASPLSSRLVMGLAGVVLVGVIVIVAGRIGRDKQGRRTETEDRRAEQKSPASFEEAARAGRRG